MIYCTIGVPSRFSEFCEVLLLDLVAAQSDRPQQFFGEGLSQIGREVLSRNCLNAIIIARQPEAALCREIVSRELPVAVTLEHPEDTVRALKTDHGVPHTEAIRRVANSMASIVPIIRAKRGLTLFASETQSQFAVAKAMVDQFGLSLDDDAIERVLANFPMRPREKDADNVHDDDMPLSIQPGFETLAPNAPTIKSAIEPLWRHLQGEPLQEIVWPPQLFMRGDAHDQAPISPIDLTGAERCLVFGPFIRLPEGPWSCSVTFGCSERVKGVRMIAEVYAGVALNRISFELTDAGVFEVEFSFVNANPDALIEVRLLTAEAVFEGEIMLGQVRMFPLKAKRLAVA